MNLNTYQKTAIATVLATLFLIFVGGLVRAAGAGLGCPDWPKCFGLWIPPTNIADLPAGFDARDFNVYKTWIEYLNRLVGVVIGLLITATFLLSLKYRKSKPEIFYSSGLAFVLVLIQGWLGGQVVKTGLNEWMITIHMVLAMIIVNVLIFAAYRATQTKIKIRIGAELRKKLLWLTGAILIFTMIQLVLGTQVRESVDLIKNAPMVPPRSAWLEIMMDGLFPAHRSFSWVLMLAAGMLLYILKNENAEGVVNILGQSVALLIFLQVGSGIGLAYLDMPRMLQVAHLLIVALMICSQFLLLLILSQAGKVITGKRGQGL